MIGRFKAIWVLGGLLALATHVCCAADAGGSAANPEFAGVWQIKTPLFTVRPASGEEPPLQPSAARVYREHLAARKQGETSFDNATWCASVGMPRLMFINSPFEIMIGPRHVAFMHEWNWWARIVYLKGGLSATVPPRSSHAPTEQVSIAGLPPVQNVMTPGPVGISRGEWNGGDLVVNTDHLIDTTLIDTGGIPHSDALKLTETFHLVGPDVLEDHMRLDDPQTFTHPWETVVTYQRKPGARIHEDVCLDRIKAGEPALKE